MRSPEGLHQTGPQANASRRAALPPCVWAGSSEQASPFAALARVIARISPHQKTLEQPPPRPNHFDRILVQIFVQPLDRRRTKNVGEWRRSMGTRAVRSAVKSRRRDKAWRLSKKFNRAIRRLDEPFVLPCDLGNVVVGEASLKVIFKSGFQTSDADERVFGSFVAHSEADFLFKRVVGCAWIYYNLLIYAEGRYPCMIGC